MDKKIRRGDIYFANLDPVAGSEHGGIRPVLIIQNNKLTKTENGKYSAKFALSELLICGECGTPYRRVTWTAKGFKEIKWRCINRLQYGKKYCHNSPTIAEETLHRAIVETINKFCEVQSEVSQTLRESLTEVLDPALNSSVKAAQERVSELSRKY